MTRWPEILVVLWGIILTVAFFGLYDIGSLSGRGTVKIGGLDPVYYFGTAHSLLFDHDFDLSNEFRVVHPLTTEAGGFRGLNGLPGSPYAVGYSLLSVPFLAVGTAADAALGRPSDGYGRCAVFCFNLANVVFVGIGLWCLAAFLRAAGSADWQVAFLPIAVWFSTSVGYYTFSPMSHAATFMLASVFLRTWWRVRESCCARDWAGMALWGGLLSICRWQDIIFLAGPLLYDFCRQRAAIPWRKWLAFAAAVFVCWIPQIAQWKVLYGKYITIPQGPGFLEFPPRFFFSVLFSSNHGWFVWTPLTFIGVVGLFYGTYKAGVNYWPWIVVLVLEVAVVGSMPNNWNCMDSFSIRSLTSCVTLVAFGIAAILRDLRPRSRTFLTTLILLCMAYSTAFMVQFRLDLVPRDGPLTISEILWDKLSLRSAYKRVHDGRSTPGLER